MEKSKLSDQGSGIAERSFYVGNLLVLPKSNSVRGPDGERRVESKVMAVLLLLVRHAGETVTKQEIMDAVWPDTFVGDGVLWNSISELRRLFGDDTKNPQIIETMPKKGYRLTASSVREFHPAAVEQPEGRAWWMGRISGLFLVATLLALVWWFFPTKIPETTRNLDLDRTSVLVAGIENRTGESLLDGNVTFVLQQNLLSVDSVRVASRSRVEDLLSLMGKSPETPIDEALGQEICLRDGGIDILVSGRVESDGSHYLLGLRLIDPYSGETLGATNRKAEDQGQIFAAVEELSRWVVEELAEDSSGVRSVDSFARVATSSLRALDFYRRGVSSGAQHQKAEVFFRQAIEEDPEFASAYLARARALRYLGRQQDATTSLEGAMRLRHRASPPEQAYIQGLYHQWNGEYDEAAAHYEVVMESRPEYFLDPYSLLFVFRASGRGAEVTPHLIRLADLRPNNPSILLNTASILIEVLGERQEARPMVEQANRLLSSGPYRPRLHAYLDSYWIWDRWMEGDLKGAVEQAESLRMVLSERNEEGYDVARAASFLGPQYLALGQIRAAEALYSRFATQGSLSPFLDVLALTTDNPTILQPYRQGGPLAVRPLAVLLLDPTAVDAIEADVVPNLILGSLEMVQGAIAWRRNRFSKAIPLLTEGIRLANCSTVQVWTFDEVFLGSRVLAEAWVGAGNLPEAIQVLERLAGEKEKTFPSMCALRAQLQARLAELYRQAGRENEARQAEDELRRLLAYADEDHPILKQLNYAQEEVAARLK